MIILIKSQDVGRKIVNFLFVANFEPCPILDVSPCISSISTCFYLATLENFVPTPPMHLCSLIYRQVQSLGNPNFYQNSQNHLIVSMWFCLYFQTLNLKFEKNQTKHKGAQGQKQIQPAKHSRPARFGDSPAKQGRTGAPSVLVRFF